MYFDNTSTATFKETGSLTLTIAAPADYAVTIDVARAFVKLLKRRALSYVWDQTAPSRIVVDMNARDKNFIYTDMDADLEEYILDGDIVVPAQPSR